MIFQIIWTISNFVDLLSVWAKVMVRNSIAYTWKNRECLKNLKIYILQWHYQHMTTHYNRLYNFYDFRVNLWPIFSFWQPLITEKRLEWLNTFLCRIPQGRSTMLHYLMKYINARSRSDPMIWNHVYSINQADILP